MSDNLITKFDGMNVPKALVRPGECMLCKEVCDGECENCPLQKVFDKLAVYEAKEQNKVSNVSVEPDEPKTTHNLRLSVEFKKPISFDEAKELIYNAINPVLKG